MIASYKYTDLPQDDSEITIFDSSLQPHPDGDYLSRLGIESVSYVIIPELAGTLKTYIDPISGGADYREFLSQSIPAFAVNNPLSHAFVTHWGAYGNVKMTWTSTAATAQAFFIFSLMLSKQRGQAGS